MKYNWNLDEIVRRKEYLNKQLSILKGKKYRDKILDLEAEVDSISEMMNIMNSPTQISYNYSDISEDCIDPINMIPISIYQDYYRIDPWFRKMMDELANTALVQSYDDGELPISKLNISNKELIEMSYDFYKNLPTNNKLYLNEFIKYTDPKNNYLKFMKGGLESANSYGDTFLLYYPDYKPFFIIYRENDCIDFTTLNHEINHGIWNNPMFKNTNHRYYYELNELDGLYFNYLSSKYLTKQFGIENTDNMNFLGFRSINCMLMDYYIISILVKFARANKKLDRFEYKEKLDKKISIDENDVDLIDIALSDYASRKLIYIYSYLICLDLIELDKKDPEYAFRCFENILSGKDCNSYEALANNGITFVDDRFSNFKKKMLEYKDKSME